MHNGWLDNATAEIERFAHILAARRPGAEPGALREALREIRTSWVGYAVTAEHPYPEVIAKLWQEIQRMDGIARAALAHDTTEGN
jgi:hypothetical protein